MITKVLITGANGQLGKTIKKLYSKNDFLIDFTFLTKEKLDITNKKKVLTYLKENRFDYCINCAAYTNVEQAEKTPDIAFKVNAEGVKNLAEVCKLEKVVLIHISTDYVFDGEKTGEYSINDIPNPINKYGESKLLGEKYIQETLNNYIIIRTSWLYSKAYGKNFYKTILKKTETEKELFITDEQIGRPTDTVNLSRFIFELLKEKQSNSGVLHFCDEQIMTWYDFAKQILNENGLSTRINLVKASKYLTFAKRPKNSVLKVN